jgi:hypothetical protein
MKKLIFQIVLTIAIVPFITGQDVSLTSKFDTSGIYIGDQIHFTVTVNQPSDLRLALPSFKDTLTKNIEIISGPSVDSINQAGRTTIIEKYLVTSFDSGTYQIPPVFVELKSENGIKRFYSDYTMLKVMRINLAPADTSAKIYDIINPYRAPVTIDEILPWFLLASLIAVLIWAGIRYLPRLRKEKPVEETIINPDPAHIIAFRELEKLREEQLWQKGEVKNYYTNLTEILRQYLENRFNVYSLELTTVETLDALIKTGFRKDRSAYTLLKGVLTGADLVKFAKYKPEPEEHELLFQNSWDFVVDTKISADTITEPKEKTMDGEAGI